MILTKISTCQRLKQIIEKPKNAYVIVVSPRTNAIDRRVFREYYSIVSPQMGDPFRQLVQESVGAVYYGLTDGAALRVGEILTNAVLEE